MDIPTPHVQTRTINVGPGGQITTSKKTEVTRPATKTGRSGSEGVSAKGAVQMSDLIEVLQRWYAAQCDDVWEHSFGIEIANIDNPGWQVKINGASSKKRIDLNSDRSEIDWVRIKATETEFVGHGGPGNLKEILTLAANWLE